jgi:hypothetical protein
VLTSFGIEKATHGIELTEIESENFHSTCVLWVWGRNFETGITVPASPVRVARFYSKAPNPNPGLTWIRSAAQSVSACNDDEDDLVPYMGGPSRAIPGKDGKLTFVAAEESTFVWARHMGHEGKGYPLHRTEHKP